MVKEQAQSLLDELEVPLTYMVAFILLPIFTSIEAINPQTRREWRLLLTWASCVGWCMYAFIGWCILALAIGPDPSGVDMMLLLGIMIYTVNAVWMISVSVMD